MRRVLCINYLSGFCPDGTDCDKAHPRLVNLHQLGRFV
jgi:hypothetical protein